VFTPAIAKICHPVNCPSVLVISPNGTSFNAHQSKSGTTSQRRVLRRERRRGEGERRGMGEVGGRVVSGEWQVISDK
jgi:hypothetical protein